MFFSVRFALQCSILRSGRIHGIVQKVEADSFKDRLVELNSKMECRNVQGRRRGWCAWYRKLAKFQKMKK